MVAIKNTYKKGGGIMPQSKWIPNGLFQKIQKNTPIACIDLLILRKQKNGKIEILLIKRRIKPEVGTWCLTGGRILKNESTKDAINRQAKEELGISVRIIPPWNELTPLAVFNDSTSDKQKHFVALNYPVIITKGTVKNYGPEFSESKWFSLNKPPANTGFHHAKVIQILSQNTKEKSISF